MKRNFWQRFVYLLQIVCYLKAIDCASSRQIFLNNYDPNGNVQQQPQQPQQQPSFNNYAINDLNRVDSPQQLQMPSSAYVTNQQQQFSSIVATSSYMPVFSYIGCYNDRRELRDINEKDFSYLTKINKTMPTVELCVSLCAQDGYKIAGIQA